MAVTEETEAKVRADREAAIAYADRVLAGEEPWNDDKEDEEVTPEVDGPKGDTDGDVEKTSIDDAPKNDDVGETDSDAPEVVEVDQDNPAPEPTE